MNLDKLLKIMNFLELIQNKILKLIFFHPTLITIEIVCLLLNLIIQKQISNKIKLICQQCKLHIILLMLVLKLLHMPKISYLKNKVYQYYLEFLLSLT